MHGDRIYFTDQNLNPEHPASIDGTNSHFQAHFKTFISEFTKENVRVYHKHIAAMLQQGKHLFTLYLADLKQAEERLYEKLLAKPLDILSVMEEAVKNYVIEKKNEFSSYDGVSPWQVCIISDETPKRLREIQSRLVNCMFVISGIVISCTKPYIKASDLRIKCRSCGLVLTLKLMPGQYPSFPLICRGATSDKKCPPDPYVALPDSIVIDTQSLKIQENPEEIPTGEIARTYGMISDRYNVNRCVPGDRVRITGIMMVNDMRTDNLSRGVFYITGIQKTKDRAFVQYTTQDEEDFKKLSDDPKLYEKIHRSIAPGIYGNE